jgi:hypothetical protein
VGGSRVKAREKIKNIRIRRKVKFLNQKMNNLMKTNYQLIKERSLKKIKRRRANRNPSTLQLFEIIN